MEKPRIYFETKRLIVRTLEVSDKDDYMALRMEASEIPSAYRIIPEFRDREWEEELKSSNDIFLSGFLKENRKLIASGSFQRFNTNTIEFGFDVTKSCRNQGIATELVDGMIQTVRTVFPDKAVMIRTNANNAACRKVAETCGGILCGYYSSFIVGIVDAFMESYGNIFTDKKELEKVRKNYTDTQEENNEKICIYYLKRGKK